MKGFIASLALIACFAFLMNTIAVSGEVTDGMNGVKNTVILGQRASETQYAMQHGFENAVKTGKTVLHASEGSDLSDIDRSIILCGSIELLKIKYSVEPGCINNSYGIDVSKTNEIKLKDAAKGLISENYVGLFEIVEPCVKFVRYEKENDSVVIGLNTQLDYENSIINCDAGFILSSNVPNHAVKNVIPAGTVL